MTPAQAPNPAPNPALTPVPTPVPTLAEATRLWWQIGLLSFGGPAAQIALMHRLLVEDKRWLDERRFLDALSFCMLLPGPEAMQLATYAGWRLHGVRGGLIAGSLFVLPGAVVILMLASAYAGLGDLPAIQALFLGIKAAVIVIVIEALLKVSNKALSSRAHWSIAALAFVGIFFFALPYPLIVVLAAGFGYWRLGKARAMPEALPVSTHRHGYAVRVLLLGSALWAAPLLLLAVLDHGRILQEVGMFFSRLALLSFGGAYALLAWMAQDVVGQFGWLSAEEMMDGLGLAETTPGPLILVTQFVGFFAGFRDGGWWMGLAAASITLWVTFVPCFMWIFAGAPYLDRLSANPRLQGATSGITAAVVGVILNLSLWFALQVMFRQVNEIQLGPLTLWQPVLASLDWRVLLLCGLSAVGLMWLRWSVVRVLGAAAVLGLVLGAFCTSPAP